MERYNEKMKNEQIRGYKKFSLDDKIKIFKEYSKTGKKIDGHTVFKGYPIGMWAIQIRYKAKREQLGKRTYNFSEEQLVILTELGILERQIDSTVDEKIDQLLEWNRNYPKYCLGKNSNLNHLPIELREEFNRMHKYYEYLKKRKNH